jgi:hypothetical protein
MPYKDRTAARACQAAVRERNRAYVAEVNDKTVCAHCGAQPIEWHNPEHVELNREAFRIGNMASTGRPIPSIQAEMGRCTPLCRLCHMIEDGRLRKTHCPQGHAYTNDNLDSNGKGKTRCRACNRDRIRRRKNAQSHGEWELEVAS